MRRIVLVFLIGICLSMASCIFAQESGGVLPGDSMQYENTTSGMGSITVNWNTDYPKFSAAVYNGDGEVVDFEGCVSSGFSGTIFNVPSGGRFEITSLDSNEKEIGVEYDETVFSGSALEESSFTMIELYPEKSCRFENMTDENQMLKLQMGYYEYVDYVIYKNDGSLVEQGYRKNESVIYIPPQGDAVITATAKNNYTKSVHTTGIRTLTRGEYCDDNALAVTSIYPDESCAYKNNSDDMLQVIVSGDYYDSFDYVIYDENDSLLKQAIDYNGLYTQCIYSVPSGGKIVLSASSDNDYKRQMRVAASSKFFSAEGSEYPALKKESLYAGQSCEFANSDDENQHYILTSCGYSKKIDYKVYESNGDVVKEENGA